MPNKFFTQTPGTPGQLGQSSALEALKAQIKKEEEESKQGVSTLQQIAAGKETPATFIGMEQGQSAATLFLNELTRLARTQNEDPAAVVEQHMQSESIGKTMLRDFLLGASAVTSGQPVENTRSLLLKRHMVAQELKQKQYTAAQDMVKSFIGADENIRTTDATNRATQERAAEALITRDAQEALTDVQKTEAQEQIKLEKAKELERFKNRQQPMPDSFEKALTPTVDKWIKVQNDPTATPEQREAAEAEYDNAMKILAQITAAKTAEKTGAGGAGGGPAGFKPSIKPEEYEIGYGSVKILESMELGADGQPTLKYMTPAQSPMKLSSGWQDALALASERKALVKELEETFYNIPSTAVAGLVSKAQGYQIKLRAITALATAEDGRKLIEELEAETRKLNLTGPEQNFMAQYNQLVAATVRAFTGAQATDAERQFIETTLPQMFGSHEAFASGISKLALATEWMEYKIRNRLVADDNSVADAGRYFGRLVNEWEASVKEMAERQKANPKQVMIPTAVLKRADWMHMRDSDKVKRWQALQGPGQKAEYIKALAGEITPEKIAESIGASPWTAKQRKLF